MFAIALLLGISLQAPMAAARPQEAVAVRGEAELTQAAAFDSARLRAEDQLRERWRERGDRIVAGGRPFWLPPVFTELAQDRWLADLPLHQAMRIVDRQDQQREHEFGASWQTTLWIDEDPRQAEVQELRLRRELRRVQSDVLWKSGGTAVFWALLAFALGWIDRLSRGYMTGRLLLVGLLLGSAVPAVAFLL